MGPTDNMQTPAWIEAIVWLIIIGFIPFIILLWWLARRVINDILNDIARLIHRSRIRK